MAKQTVDLNSCKYLGRVLSGCVYLILLMGFFHCKSPLVAKTDNPEKVAIERYASLVDQRVTPGQIRTIQGRFKDGYWVDVDYAHNARTGWKTLVHLNRCVQLARIYYGASNPEASISREESAGMLNQALRYWQENDFRNPNWFQNNIAVPRRLRDIMVFAENSLDTDIKEWLLDRLSEDTYGRKFGTNLIWLADIKLHLGMFMGDQDLITKSMRLIMDEINIGEGLGIQEDYSFLFHDRRLQMYSYGRGYLEVASRIAWQMRDTPWGFDEEALSVLRNFALEGYQWMARGSYSVPSTMDRSSSRQGGLTRPRNIKTLNLLAELDPDHESEYKVMIRAQRDVNAFSLSGLRHFPKADILVKHGKEGSIFVKWLSDRTLPTESINSENLRGKWLNAGNIFVVRDGTEYTNLLPFWDWDLLPGFTYVEGAENLRRKPFTGALNHGDKAVIHMDLELMDKDEGLVLKANKAWFIYGNTLVVLIGNIDSKSIGPVYTALDQSRWQGLTKNLNSGETYGRGRHRLNGETWLLHHGIAYYSGAQDQFLELRQEEVSAYWESINLRYSGEKPVSERVFHPIVVGNGNSQEYAIQLLGDDDKKQAQKGWEVIRNDALAQVIKLDSGVILGVLLKPSEEVDIAGIKLKSNTSVQFIIEDGELWAACPDRGENDVNLKVNGKNAYKTIGGTMQFQICQ